MLISSVFVVAETKINFWSFDLFLGQQQTIVNKVLENNNFVVNKMKKKLENYKTLSAKVKIKTAHKKS